MSKAAIAKKPTSPVAKPKTAPAKTKPTASTAKIVAGKKTLAKPKPATKVPLAMPAPAPKAKAKKPKLVRDCFKMPEAEYQVLGDIKKACLMSGIAVKKSELLRVGVALLKTLNAGKLKEVLASLPPLKAGRPKSGK